MRHALIGHRISLDMLDRLFNAELLAFHSDFEVQPVPIEQDLRAGAIGGIAAFTPEAVTLKGREQLRQILTTVHERPDFEHFGWYRIPYLDAAQFLLSSDLTSLSWLIANINHHNSSLRSALHAPLALVAPRLSLNDGELANRIECCLKSGFLYNESLMCVFCGLRDVPERKVELVMEWQKRINLVPQDAKTLSSIITGAPISNSLVVDELSENFRYLFCRLLDPEITCGSPKEQLKFFFDLSGETIWKRMAAHPLLKSLVFLKKKAE